MSTAPSIDTIKQTMRDTWMAGDFGVIARTIASAGADFASGLELTPGLKVLDVATGTGNVAIPLAEMGCEVTGVDIAPNLLEQARARADEAGLAIAFDEGDAEDMPYAEAAFDAVVTMFGAMFAPRPEVVTAELARVLRPDGLLAMANWNPESFTGKMFRTGAAHVPPPPGIAPPVLWGDDATVRQRLDAHFEDIETVLVPIDFDLPMSVPDVVNLFRTYFGPTATAFARLDIASQQALQADLEALWSANNIAEDSASRTLVRNEYLRITARRRG